jgi:hypothetical protein
MDKKMYPPEQTVVLKGTQPLAREMLKRLLENLALTPESYFVKPEIAFINFATAEAASQAVTALSEREVRSNHASVIFTISTGD